MNALVRQGIGLPDFPDLKKALGIGDRKLVHRWAVAGGKGYLPGYATQLDKLARAAKVMKAGGNIAIGLGVAASAVKIHEVCRWGESEACRKVRFTEGGKILGTVGAGGLGGAVGSKVALKVCATVMHPLGRVGCFLVVGGAVSYGFGELGSWGGERVGEIIYKGDVR